MHKLPESSHNPERGIFLISTVTRNLYYLLQVVRGIVELLKIEQLELLLLHTCMTRISNINSMDQ